MTKQRFLEEIRYYGGPNSHFLRHRREELSAEADYRVFDPKLADLVRAASDKWFELYLYMKERAEQMGVPAETTPK